MIPFLKEGCKKLAEFLDKNSTCCSEVKKEEFLVTEDKNVGLIELFDVYQSEAAKTFKPELAADVKEAMKYLALKLSEEVGEINGPIAKHLYHGKSLDTENIKEEISDCLWYLANIANIFGFKLSEVATYNIEKLRKRHGENYNKKHYIG